MNFKVIKLLSLLLVLAVQGCAEEDPVMQDIRKQGKLIVLTRNAPTTYYLGPDDHPMGFEYDLSKAFADSLNVQVEYKLFDNIEDIMQAINKGEGHIAAAGLTRTDVREQKSLFGPGYKTVQQQLVCHRYANVPKDISDLLGHSILIIAESSYEESLNELKVDYPALKWEVTRDLSTEQVLEKVANREVDCTVTDSNIVSLNRHYYPDIMVAISMTEKQQLAWVLAPQSDYFKEYVANWFEQVGSGLLMNEINERYYGYADIFDYYNNHVYLKRIEQRLPKYTEAFKLAGKQYQIPWTLLVAQSYQESGWDAKAKSHTGVRGLMMLTQNTATAMGVKNRTDPLQSIQGGAKYLQRMLNKIPKDVAEADRIWFALAAYNVGFAHLLDARQLARDIGKSPSHWHDMKEVLPLLSQKQYYKKLKYGYARGSEPVRYIDRIRSYHDVLLNFLSKKS